MTPGPLTFRFVARGDEKACVTSFVQDAYERTYGTRPRGAAAYAAAFRGQVIVACLGLEYADESGRLPVERLYRLVRETLPLPVTATNTVQFGRLVTLERQLTGPVVYAGLRAARARGFRYGLLEHTDAVHRIIARFGFRFWDLPEACLDRNAVPPEDLAFYTQCTPRPYLIDLDGACRSLWERLAPDMQALLPYP